MFIKQTLHKQLLNLSSFFFDGKLKHQHLVISFEEQINSFLQFSQTIFFIFVISISPKNKN